MEVILKERPYVAAMQSMIDVGKKVQERWRKEHAVSAYNKK